MTYVGLIPIDDFLYYLSEEKQFTKEQAVNYALDNYNIDISKYIVDNKIYFNPNNIYKNFKNTLTSKRQDIDTREYFNQYIRKQFTKFYKTYFDDEVFDQLSGRSKPSVTHHIYPLCFSGDNSFENLLAISTLNHDLLHKNPLEHIKKYCYQAVDYLYWLYHRGMTMIYNKNKMLFNNYEHFSYIINSLIDLEMNIFYNSISEKHKEKEVA